MYNTTGILGTDAPYAARLLSALQLLQGSTGLVADVMRAAALDSLRQYRATSPIAAL